MLFNISLCQTTLLHFDRQQCSKGGQIVNYYEFYLGQLDGKSSLTSVQKISQTDCTLCK